MITIDVENKKIEVENPNGKEFQVHGFTVPMSNGFGFIANLPDEVFNDEFTVKVVTETETYIPEEVTE
jgi:hypothetical protein